MPCNLTPKAFTFIISFLLLFGFRFSLIVSFHFVKQKKSGFISFLFLFSSMFCLIKVFVFFDSFTWKQSKSFEVFNLSVAALPDGARGQLFCQCNKTLHSSHIKVNVPIPSASLSLVSISLYSVVSVVSVVRKKFIGQIEFIISRTTSCICRFCCIEHLYGRFP